MDFSTSTMGAPFFQVPLRYVAYAVAMKDGVNYAGRLNHRFERLLYTVTVLFMFVHVGFACFQSDFDPPSMMVKFAVYILLFHIFASILVPMVIVKNITRTVEDSMGRFSRNEIECWIPLILSTPIIFAVQMPLDNGIRYFLENAFAKMM